jgi:hypothetical protein
MHEIDEFDDVYLPSSCEVSFDCALSFVGALIVPIKNAFVLQ